MKALVYRELMRSRRIVIFTLFASVMEAMLFILLALSFRVGNLALLPQAMREQFFELNNTVSLPLMAFLAGIIMMTAASSDSESSMLWRMFRTSTPVTPLKFAGAKYLMLGCWLLVSVLCASLFSCLFCLAADIRFTLDNFATAVGCIEVVLIFSVVSQVIQAFMRASKDKAGLVLAAVFLVPVAVVGFVCTENNIDLGITPEKLTELCVTLLPFTPLVLAVIFGAGVLLTAAAYKRREK
ncbi:MAG: ABC-2 transporter permease [Oscillospiraceae bacterium]|nr:ABC-2 transporter permease [Oscillospiraceae bacterium]